MNCLFIQNEASCKPEIESYLVQNKVEYDVAQNRLYGIQKVQELRYDVIVLDVLDQNYQIENEIRIIKECNPDARIIVRADNNSKELEAKVRKEKIYFYHVNSLGIQDFTAALASALQINHVQ